TLPVATRVFCFEQSNDAGLAFDHLASNVVAVARFARIAKRYMRPSAATLPTARRGLQSDMNLLQAEVERCGAQIFDLADRHPESIFSKAGRYPDDVMKTLRKKRRQGIGFTVDLLGEAVVSEEEAREYAARCQQLLEHLARETRGWTDPLGKNSELFPVVNVSVKISALYSQMNPADPADAIAHLAPKLRPILRRAKEFGAFINLDMESYAH